MRNERGCRGRTQPPKESKPPRDALEVPSRALSFMINRGFEEPDSGRRSGAEKEWLADDILLASEAAEVLRALSASDHPFERGAVQRHGSTGLGVAAAHSALSTILEAANTSGALAIESLRVKERLIVEALRETGIKPWLEIVRQHHSPTYRHSLLVTGVAVAFAQSVEMRLEDQQLITRAALLHDVGKRFIPLDILDKPTKLTAKEMNKIREHPVRGHKLLLEQGGFSEQILDCVLHHHELLDGSGYPDGLKGAEIGDLVRITTTADIFSALIEPRAYKAPLPAKQALEIMMQMDGKLDADLMKAFRPIVSDVTW
jgi:putative nucleotidyltransferase with HDIG domain